MDAHQQPGAMDALINDGLQHYGGDLDRLVHEGVQDVLTGALPGDGGMMSLPMPGTSLGLPPFPELIKSEGGPPPEQADPAIGHKGPANGTENHSTMRDTNGSGINNRAARRRNARTNFTTDVDEDSNDDLDDEFDDDDDGAQETGSSGRPGRNKRQRRGDAVGNGQQKQKGGGMTGRFSGRLPSKEDERKLAEECSKMGTLLSADGTLTTLPNIIRAMANGSVRAYLEQQRMEMNHVTEKLRLIENEAGGFQTLQLGEQVIAQQHELDRLRSHVRTLEQQLIDAGTAVWEAEAVKQENASLHRVNSMHALALQQATAPTVQHVTVHAGTLPINPAPPQAQQQVVALPNGAPAIVQTLPQATSAAPQVMQVTSAPILSNGVAGVTAQPLVVATMPAPAGVAPSGLRSVPSSAHLVDAMGQPTGMTVAVQPTTVVTTAPAPVPASAPAPSGDATGAAANNLNEHAQQLAVTAKLHEAAKTEASAQAQQLATVAQQHAQASVHAAQQAEELKKSLAVMPEGTDHHHAAAVQTLEAQAQAHANMTTQVVAQARGMHEKAQAHEKEQIKAITQASVLQAHAQSLTVSAAQMEAHVVAQAATTGVTTAVAEPQQLPTIAVAPLPSVHVSGAPSAAAGTSSAGAALAATLSTDPQPQALTTMTDPNQQPITPHSNPNGTAGILASTTLPPAAAQPAVAIPSIAAPGLATTQPMLVVQQPPVAGGTASVVHLASIPPATAVAAAAAAAPPPTLVPTPSGDHSAEVVALQQQIAVLQAQQHAQQQINAVQSAAVAQVAQAQAVHAHTLARPPIPPQMSVQVVPATTVNQPVATMTLVGNANSIAMPVMEGAGSIPIPAPTAVQAATHAQQETAGTVAPNAEIQPPPTATTGSGGETAPPQQQQMPDIPAAMLVTDAAGATAAASMDPVISLPTGSTGQGQPPPVAS